MREFDVVVFGATGFTGRLVAEYLASKKVDVKWAIAGRSKEKLEAVKRDLPNAPDVPILIADANDVGALDAIVPRAKVVLTTVGPFVKHGKKLVAACARLGTDYVDSTGEVDFMRASIDDNDKAAIGTRTRIVHACGFDSLPFDLGVFMVWSAHKEKLKWAKSFVTMKGGASGGTIATMLDTMEAIERDPGLKKILGNPYALDPDPSRRGADGRDRPGVRFDEDLGRWTAPFIMAQVNTRVVRRSNALLDRAYGDEFRYSEAMSIGKGPKGAVSASLLTAGLGAFAGAAAFGPTRRLLAKRLPKPGEGPSKATRDAGFFKVKILAESTSGRRVTGRVEGQQDPGYAETAKMLAESALCLARDTDALPDRFGVLTPATAMGLPLIERLRRAGMVFEVADGAGV